MSLKRIIPIQTCAAEQRLPLFDIGSVRQIEADALSKVESSEKSLMQRAGFSLLRLVRAKYSHAQWIWIVAGAGNNGGDAIEAAICLHKAGYHVGVTLHGHAQSMSQVAANALAQAQLIGLPLIPLDQIDEHVLSCDLIIDGLLGIGLDPDRALSEDIRLLIEKINQCCVPVLAVDVPSGLVAETGDALAACVKADATLTFLTIKPGLVTGQGRQYCGDIYLDTLDMALTSLAKVPACSDLYIASAQPAPRRQNTHKGSFGDVLVVGGASGMTGAVLLASRAALVAGAGRVYTCLLDKNQLHSMPVDMGQPELMLRSYDAIEQTFDLHRAVVACGCGAGQEVTAVLPDLLQRAAFLVLDADALNAIAKSDELQQLLSLRQSKHQWTVITPHPLEAARLLGCTTQEVQANRLEAALQLAERFKVTCVLKGSGTIISTPDCRPLINSSGNAALATAGSGDVLTGYLAANLAMYLHSYQGAYSNALLQGNVAQSVWRHGHAADVWVKQGHIGVLPASRLLELLL